MRSLAFRAILSVPEASSTRRNLGLDILRAVAISLVVCCHGMILLPPAPGANVVYWWTGVFGVELFFVLSGYLIGSILFDLCLAHPTAIAFRGRLPNFWIRRWFRTLPNYYLFLVVNIVLYPAAVGDFRKYLLFCQNLLWRMGALMAESWSLAVEEWFYLTFPLLLLALIGALPRRPRLAFGLAAVAYISVFVAWRSAVSWHVRPDWDLDVRKVVALRLDSIAYGALMMLVMRSWPQKMRKARYLFVLAGIAGIAVASYLLMDNLRQALPPLSMANMFTITSASFACCLPLAVYGSEHAGPSAFRSAIAGVSIVSYSTYLLHSSVAMKAARRLLGGSAWYWQGTLYLVLCVVLSILVYNLYERRMTALRSMFSPKVAVA